MIIIAPAMAGRARLMIQMVAPAMVAIFSLLRVVPKKRIANEIFTPTSTIAGEGIMLPTKKMHATALAVCNSDEFIPKAYKTRMY